MTKPLISPEIVDILAAALPGIVGDAPRILADARRECPALPADASPDRLMCFVGEVLERCVAHLDGSTIFTAAPSAVDIALANATLRSIARWPESHAREAEAWQLALNLSLLDNAATPARKRA